jgi:hypothetical protein
MVKRGLSVATILILAPLVAMIAWFIAFWGMIEILLALGEGPGWHDGLIVLVATGAFVATLAGMIAWAVRAYKRQQAVAESMRDDSATDM